MVRKISKDKIYKHFSFTIVNMSGCNSSSEENVKQLEMPIKPDMTISDVIDQYPQSIEIMLSYGLHCVGCHANVYDTLESGSLGHGMPEDVFKNMIDELNSAALNKSDKDLELTPRAIEVISEMAKQENKAGLKIKVIKGGCAGSSYDLSLEDSPEEGDKVIEFESLKIFIDNDSFNKIKGSTIDYVKGLQGAGVKITNPNAKAGCGCGNSFR